EMSLKKIPILNDVIDFGIIIHILRKNTVFFFSIFFLAILIAFLFIRYSQPIYQTNSILQINKEESSKLALLELTGIENQMMGGGNPITSMIEQIRSKEFLKRTLRKLPLDISYFSKGVFLDNEMYKTSPFFVEVRDWKEHLLDEKIYLNFYSQDSIELYIERNGVRQEFNFLANQWHTILGGQIYINISNFEQIKENQKQFKKDLYYFIVHSPASAYSYHMKGLNISLLSDVAQTISVSYSGNNPKKAMDIVNTICEDFLTYNIEQKQARVENMIKYIDSQIEAMYLKLSDAEKKLFDFRKQFKLSNENFKSLQSTLNLNLTGENDRNIDNIEQQYIALYNLQKRLQNRDSINAVEIMATFTKSQPQSMIMNFLNAINQLQNEKEELLLNVTENNQKIKILDRQIENQKKLLSDYILITNENLRKEKEELLKKSQKKDTSKNTVQFDELEFSRLTRLYKIHEDYYNQLIEKKAQFQIAKAGIVTQNLILEKAIEPKTPVYPVKSKILIMCIIGAFFVCLLTAAIKYLFYSQITSFMDMPLYTEVPILGIIPHSIKAKQAKGRFVIENKPDSLITESFRTIRANLDFLNKTNSKSKIIAVSSTISGEGKSFISINIAGILALSGKKTVILDMDLRKPKLHLEFDLKNEIGITNFLVNKCCLEECLKPTSIENLYLIPSGPIPPNPAELSDSQNYKDLLKELKNTYDYIIIDTPPIGIVTDAIFSYQIADFCVYVLRVDYSKRLFLNNVNHIYEAKNIRNLSLVLNGAKLLKSRYSYAIGSHAYTGYNYGYGYYNEEPKEKLSRFQKLLKKLNAK
ncbi:MAG: polysaccharide biosynthesis tyrosine autokinase, partial [Endomicrobiia bacterium]